MFSIDQRRSEEMLHHHLRTTQPTNERNEVQLVSSSTMSRCCDITEIKDDQMVEILANDDANHIVVVPNLSSGLGMMRRKKSLYAFDTSCCKNDDENEQQPITSFSSSSGASSSSSSSDGESTSSSSLRQDMSTSQQLLLFEEQLLLSNQQPRNFVSDLTQLILNSNAAATQARTKHHQQLRQVEHAQEVQREDAILNLSNSLARKVMEPYLRRARIAREASRGPNYHRNGVSASIASSMGVPYTALRKECPFLFDVSSYPLHTVLAQALDIDTLSKIHTKLNSNTRIPLPKEELLLPLRDKTTRTPFHTVYDNFVTSFCIPLLHSMAISKGVVHQSTSDRIYYRYQAFPHIHIVRPNDNETMYSAPSCDSSLGYSLGCLTFYIPLTPAGNNNTNCLFVESHPGKEDWHPLVTKSIGLGYLFDGTRCLHFDVPSTPAGGDSNDDDRTSRVAIMFRVLIYRDDSYDESTSATTLCPRHVRDNDTYYTSQSSSSSPSSSFYDEAYIDIRSTQAVVKKYSQQRGSILIDPPSPLLGHPFCL